MQMLTAPGTRAQSTGERKWVYSGEKQNTVYSFIINYCVMVHMNNCKPLLPCMLAFTVLLLNYL